MYRVMEVYSVSSTFLSTAQGFTPLMILDRRHLRARICGQADMVEYYHSLPWLQEILIFLSKVPC